MVHKRSLCIDIILNQANFFFIYNKKGTLIGPPGGKYYQTWANYYLKFFQAYQESGLNFWAMTAQNEPSDGYMFKFPFNSMGFTPETQAEFIVTNLGPTLEQNGFGDIKIMILDDQRIFLPSWAERVIIICALFYKNTIILFHSIKGFRIFKKSDEICRWHSRALVHGLYNIASFA